MQTTAAFDTAVQNLRNRGAIVSVFLNADGTFNYANITRVMENKFFGDNHISMADAHAELDAATAAMREATDLEAVGLELIAELDDTGSVWQPGAVLRRRPKSGTYHMNSTRNVFDRHELDVANTPPARLAAHWLAFAQAKR